MKQIRLKDRTHVVQACSRWSCPLFRSECDCNGYEWCELGGDFEFEVGKLYKKDIFFPENCPLEEYIE